MAEYLSKAMALAQDAAKLSLRFSEGLVDNALEFGLDTPGGFFDNAEFKLTQVRKELGSGTDKEKVAGLKRLLAAIAKGHDASEYFADVVKNVASGNLEMRRLVYMYLLRYAEQEPDLALLSVNTFQRDLADSSQVIRAMALRVMSSIRVPVISPIVVMAIRKLANDRSPHVRKTAALAVCKLLRLDASLRGELAVVVGGMLVENSPLAVGSVIRAFRAVSSPGQYDAVHVHFRRWCVMLAQLDEWGQVELTKLLTAYARTQFRCPGEEGARLDADHALLLHSMHPLLQSRNSAVVMAAVSALCHLAPASQRAAVARPLVRLMRSGRETGYVVLTNIHQIAQTTPAPFHAHVRSFFVTASDPPMTRRLKLRVLAALVDRQTVGILVPEIAGYTRSAHADTAVGAVGVMLACAQRLREATLDCFQSLLLLAARPGVREEVANAAMHAVRVLLLDGSVRDAQDRRAMTLYDILCYLARTLDRCRADVARAHVYALVAEFAQTKFGCLHGLDVLRAAVRSFRDEGPQAKMQVLELSARLMCLAPCGGRAAAEARAEAEAESKNTAEGKNAAESKNAAAASGPLAPVLAEHRELLAGLHAFAFTLARYDTSFDVRDRARTLRALCPLAGDEAHAEEMPRVLEMAKELIVSATTDMPAAADSHVLGAGRFTVASLSLTLGRPVAGYAPLADWPLENVRGVDRGASVANLGPGPGSGRNLGSPGSASIAGAISIAGISGRAQPSGGNADYSTPRSHVANNEEDLDAFLDSVDDSSSHAKMQNFAHAQQSLQKTAILYHQSNISSDSESTSESEEESESDDDDDGAAAEA
ncbi:AP-3 complex subunit beta, partial [Kickxella alabastrina]